MPVMAPGELSGFVRLGGIVAGWISRPPVAGSSYIGRATNTVDAQGRAVDDHLVF